DLHRALDSAALLSGEPSTAQAGNTQGDEAPLKPESGPASPAEGIPVPATHRVQIGVGGPAGVEAGRTPHGPGYEGPGLLGRGGMGVVYRARQVALNRVVALKMVLHAEHAGEEQRQRFLREAEALARLQHPHVVQVHEVGEHAGLAYLALEYCPQGSL